MNEAPTETPPLASLQLINRSAVKKYALEVSRRKRAGKFTRVSADFLNDVEAALDSAIRGIDSGSYGEIITPAPGTKFMTGLAGRKAAIKLDLLAVKIIDSKVMRHPSLGCTLK